MAQRVWGCSLARPLPSPPNTGWGQLRGPRAPHCLQVLGPQAPSRVGRAEQTPSVEGVTCFTVSLSASMGFIGYWAPVAPRVTLLRKSGPQGMVRLPPGSGWAEAWLFARQRGVRGAVVQPPRAEPVLWPTLRAQGGHPWRGQRGPSWGVLGQEASRPRVNTRKSFPRSLGTESWDALWGCQGADRLRTGSLLVACSRCGSQGLRAGRAGVLGRPLGLWLLQPSPRVQPSLPPPLRAGLAPRGWSNHHEPLSSWSPALEGPVTVREPEGVPTAAPRPVLRLTPPHSLGCTPGRGGDSCALAVSALTGFWGLHLAPAWVLTGAGGRVSARTNLLPGSCLWGGGLSLLLSKSLL